MYYFAYASNLSLDQMRRICGWHCRLLGRAKLPDFEVGVGKRGYLNIKQKKGEVVQGILYEIDEDGLSILDEFEGYPSVFGRQEVLVYDDHNIKYKAQIFFEPPEEFVGNKPKEEFFKRLISAARESHLPEEWIKKLENFAQSGDSK